MYNLQELERKRNSSKTKLIAGIILTVIGIIFGWLGAIMSMIDYDLIMIAILLWPFWFVGIPLIIVGAVNYSKHNKLISEVQTRNAFAQMSHQQPYAQPQYAPQYAQPQYAQPQYSQPQPAPAQPPQPQYTQAQPTQAQPQPQQTQTEQTRTQQEQPRAEEKSHVELDWRKYNPLNAGVSYNIGKNYNFHRADGFVGSVPQKFIDRTFPRCPMCCSNQPYWTISQHNQMSWKGNLYLFKCSSCQTIISMSMPDVTTLGNGGSGVAFNPNVGLTNLAVKASSGKDAGAVYAVIESVGQSGITRECEGKEFKLEHLQDMFLRK